VKAEDGSRLSKRGNPIIERHLLYKRIEEAEIGDAMYFPLRPDENVKLAANRIRSRLWQDKQFRYKCRPARRGVWVTKIGRWHEELPE
jgi:hypothetical protein